MRFFGVLSLALLVPSLVLSAVPKREWTVLVYSAGDEGSKEREGDFTVAALQVLKDFEKIKSLQSDDVAVVLQYDASGDDRDGVMHNREWRRRLEYRPNAPADRLASRGIPEAEIRAIDPAFTYDEPDTGNPVTLKKFVSWAVKAYPAKHYLLIVQAHSWGKLGFSMDFNLDGEDKFPASMIKNHEFRRVMQEVYVEDAKLGADRNIPHGKLDAILVDACVTGQIDSMLEMKEVSDYFVGTTLEIPFFSVPYSRILDPFFEKVIAAKKRGEDTGAPAFVERNLLVPAVKKFVTSHGPGPENDMAHGEKQVDVVEMFAIRNRKLDDVAAAIRRLVSSMPKKAKDAIQDKLPRAVWSLRDTDENADLLQLAKNFQIAYATEQGPEWTAALQAARALEATLGMKAPNDALTRTRVTHPEADGAWISADIDTIAPNRELAACMVMKAFATQNWEYPSVVPLKMKKKSKSSFLGDLSCNDEFGEPGGKNLSGPKEPESGKAFKLDRLVGWTLAFRHKVPAYLTETRDARGNLTKRTLHLWVKKPSRGALDASLYLRFPGAYGVNIEYIKGDPQKYVKKQRGFEGQLLKADHEKYEPEVITEDPALLGGPNGLYVAEAHSNGAHFKQGFGIFLGMSFDDAHDYQNGNLPLEQVEALLGMRPYSLTMETYLKDFAALQRQARARSHDDKLELRRTGVSFYRMLRIAETGWADVLDPKK